MLAGKWVKYQHRHQGCTHGIPRGPAPWDLNNTIFSRFLPLNYAICIFEACFFSFLLYGRTEEACRMMIRSLHNCDFSHPTGHYRGKKSPPPPVEKILGALLIIITQGCGAVTFLVGSGSGSGEAFWLRLRLRLRAKYTGSGGSGSGSDDQVLI